MKLSKVRLKNFQIHEDSIIEFSPGFNTIIGKTNSGKSAIFRCFEVVYSDKWNKEYVRYGKDNSELEFIFDTGDRFYRIKGQDNIAEFISANNTKHTFQSFGDKLPDQLKNLLKIPDFKIDVDKEINVNISSQQDPLFLISPKTYSAPLVAKFFSRLSGIHIIDTAIRNIEKDRKQEIETIKKNDEIITENSKILKDLEQVFEWKKILDSKLEEVSVFKQKINKLEILKNLKTVISQFSDRKNALKIAEKDLEKIDIIKLDLLIEKLKLLINLKDFHVSIIKLKEKFKDINDKLETANIELNKVETEKRDFLFNLKVCPLCGNNISDKEKLCNAE